MSSPAPQPQPAPNTQQADDTQHHRQVLRDLIDMGTDLARAVHRRATRESGPNAPAPANDPAPDPTLAFDRIARCVRRCIALARKLAESPSPSPAHGPAERRTAARKRVIRDVEDAIQRTAQGANAESLHAELADRLDAPDLDDDLATRPVADIIADICRDLGLATLPGARPWKRRTPADVEALCARAAQAVPARPRTAAPSPTPAAPSRPADPPPTPDHPAWIAQAANAQPRPTPPEPSTLLPHPRLARRE